MFYRRNEDTETSGLGIPQIGRQDNEAHCEIWINVSRLFQIYSPAFFYTYSSTLQSPDFIWYIYFILHQFRWSSQVGFWELSLWDREVFTCLVGELMDLWFVPLLCIVKFSVLRIQSSRLSISCDFESSASRSLQCSRCSRHHAWFSGSLQSELSSDERHFLLQKSEREVNCSWFTSSVPMCCRFC